MKIQKTAYLESEETKDFIQKYIGKFLAKKLKADIDDVVVNDDFSVQIVCAAEEPEEEENDNE